MSILEVIEQVRFGVQTGQQVPNIEWPEADDLKKFCFNNLGKEGENLLSLYEVCMRNPAHPIFNSNPQYRKFIRQLENFKVSMIVCWFISKKFPGEKIEMVFSPPRLPMLMM